MAFKKKTEAVSFVRSQSIYNSTHLKQSCNPQLQKDCVDGAGVKHFYEDVVGINKQNNLSKNTSTSPPCVTSTVAVLNTARKKKEMQISPSQLHSSLAKSKSKPRKSLSRDQRNCQHNFLRCAQDGDIKQLRATIDAGVDINAMDQYGWTALMCAAHAGQSAIVCCLLNAGVNIYVKDSQSRTARDIAKLAKQYHIVGLLDGHNNDDDAANSVVHSGESPFHCTVCKCTVKGMTVDKHNTSTVHILNCQTTSKATSYVIPESNRGFQMMLHSGWDKEKGLGSTGQGRKCPVKTVLKTDRHCLGTKSNLKAKVTHFGPNDLRSVKTPFVSSKLRHMKASTISLKSAKQKLCKQKAMERSFRRQFNVE